MDSNIFSKFINYLSSGTTSSCASDISKTKEEMYYCQKDNFIQQNSSRTDTKNSYLTNKMPPTSDNYSWVHWGSELFQGSFTK